MLKLAFIGAGSLVFTRNLCSDILLVPALQNCTLALMDIDPARLEQARQVVQTIVDRRGLKTRIEATTDRRAAIRRADYVVTTFQQGGLEAYRTDIEIPQRYGVEQCVGDTLGPGGVFRALRTIPVLLDICRDMDARAPDALLLNYVNPMSANCWAVARAAGRPHVGLCHSVQGTSELLARWVGVSHHEVVYRCAGINHQAFFLEFRRRDRDLYPLIWQAIEKPEIYAAEPVRIELMKHFGYFVTESSGHASEYVPYFRKTARMVEQDLVPRFKNPEDHWFNWGRTGGYLHYCTERLSRFQNEHAMLIAGGSSQSARGSGEIVPAERTHEYGSFIVEAIETHRPTVIAGNVPNAGLIANLPPGCCVEVPCLVDGRGIQPTVVGAMPPQLAALNRTNINVQELTVEAALTGSRDAIYHAVMLDPLTAAVCTLDQIHALVDEMIQVQADWLPTYH
jgi:alpha-galactosidase